MPTANPALTDYLVEYKASAGSTWLAFADGVSTFTTATVTGLTNNTPYDFRVSAVNSVGAGLASGTASATPIAPPSQVTGLSATSGNTQVLLSWSSLSFTPPVSSYIIEYKASASPTWLTFGSTTQTSSTVTSLTNNTSYDFRVSAVNSAGTGTPSATASATPAAPPGQVTNLTATFRSGQVTLSWTAVTATPSVTDYLVEYKANASPTWLTFNDGVSTTTTATVTGLTDNTLYDFRVSAINSAGTGPASSTLSVTPFPPPAQVTGLSGTAGNGQVSLSWTAVAPPVTSYTTEYKTSASPTWLTFGSGISTNTTVNGLTNGTSYDFRVTANNNAGSGLPSATVTTTPFSLPQVTGLTATAGNAQVVLSWTAVSASPVVTDYKVEFKPSSGSTFATFADGTSTATTATVTGITNTVPYDFRVSAISSAGTGTPSATATATPFVPITTGFTYRYSAKNPNGNGILPSNNTAISTWVNTGSLGTARNATQATTSFIPVFRTSAFGSSPGIYFDGTDDSLAMSTDVTLGTLTIVMFFKPEILTQDAILLGSRANNSGVAQVMRYDAVSSPALFRAHNGATVTANTTASTNSFVAIYRRANTSSALTIRVNGVNLTTSGALGAGVGLVLGQIGALGGFGGNGSRSATFRGWMGEIIIYGSLLSDSACAVIEDYFASQWV
ncbi:fibronectin type III domain-containing protein [Asticcacaulis sp.]|uniref:fibronectin type III domain-containing protein n=1 Tax=Asticcacaulis sp. TaxID=1872648 RepID=UPI0034574F36